MAAEGPLTLRMLRRIDPTIQAICHTTKHVALYNFSSGKWHRSDIQGPLYLAQALDGSLKMVVLNRHGRGDMLQAVNIIKDIQHEGAFFMYSTKLSNEIIGLWFPSIDESNIFAHAIGSAQEQPVLPMTQSKSIMSILKQAVGTNATPIVVQQNVSISDVFASMRRELSIRDISLHKFSPDEFLELMRLSLRNDQPLLASLTQSFNAGE